MNTEKIEKLKKALSNSKIPADLKPKIEAEIKRLEDLDSKNSTPKEEKKEEEKPVASKTTSRKPRAKKSVAPKTSVKKPSETSKPKRTPMSLAKEIRKEGESWSDARARASKMMKDKTQTVTKNVESELDKLSKLVKSKKELRSQVGRTNLLIDAKRKAKPMGRRISKEGNVYYENRANRTDKGTYGKYHLAEGGYLTDPTFGNFQNQVFAGGGGVKPTLKKGDNVVVIGKRWFDRANGNTYHTAMVLVNGQSLGKSSMTYGYEEAYLQTAKEILLQYYNLPKGMKETSPLWQLREYGVTLTKTVSDGLKRDLAIGGSVTNERLHVNHNEDYEVRYAKLRPSRKGYKGVRGFELGGVMATDLAGHTGGGDAGFNAGMPLDGFSNTAYTGLVGETGAMSSGEMFMNGGGLPSGAEQSYMITDALGNPAQHYARGGGVRQVGNREYSYGRNWTNDHRHVNKGEDHEVKYTRKGKFLGIFDDGGAVNSMSELDAEMMLKELYKNGKISQLSVGNHGLIFMSIKDGQLKSYQSYKDAYSHYLKSNFATGGALTNERKHVNYNEDYEVRYAKPRPSRKGYKGKSSFSRGGLLGQSAKVKFLSEEFASLDLIDELKAKLKTQKNNVEDKDVIAFAYTDYGGDILDKYAIEYFLENHPNNIVVESTSYSGKNAFVFGKPAKEWMEETEDYPLGFEDFESFYYDKENEDFEEGINFFIEDLKRDYSFDEDEVRDSLLEQFSGYFNVSTSGLDYSEDTMINYLKENDLIKEEYNKGGALTNERLHVNHNEDYEVSYAKPRPTRKGYKGARKFMAGGSMETPRIYVADLEAYNNGRLVGEWLDLADYNDADELMEAIQDVLKKSGGEEYAIHDYENFPSNLYSEYMSRNDFQALYDVMETAKENDLPLSVVQEIVSQYGEGGVDEFYGKFDNEEDFAYQQVEELGLENFSSPEYYVYITDTDRRLLAGEIADSYVDDIRDEDNGNRVIEEAGMDVLEYQEADSETQEEMLNEAVEIVRDEYYDNWYDGLSDPYYFLVDEQGMYSPDDFFKASFISVDYEKLARDLEQDYTFVYSDDNLYVFNIR